MDDRRHKIEAIRKNKRIALKLKKGGNKRIVLFSASKELLAVAG